MEPELTSLLYSYFCRKYEHEHPRARHQEIIAWARRELEKINWAIIQKDMKHLPQRIT